MESLVDIPNDVGALSGCGLSLVSGTPVALWGMGDTLRETKTRLKLLIAPDSPVIIGRAEGHKVPYLHPAYRATAIVPGTGQSVLRNGGKGDDGMVSRGHFMLRGVPRGIILVNGVPQLEGGIRPPLNGTRLCAPESRIMDPCEEYFIEYGLIIELLLPNKTQIQIDAWSPM